MDTDPNETTENLEESAAPVTDNSSPEADTAPADEFDTGAETFDRAYVEKLRKEAASYRTKAQPYAEVFDGIADEDREVLLDMARQYKTDPKAAISYFEQVTNGLRETFAEEIARTEDELNRPLTRGELDKIFAERETKSKQEADTARITAEAKDLGYDADNPMLVTLLDLASKTPGGDLKAAHDKIEALYEARVQAAIDKMKADADSSPTAPSSGSGAAPSGERQLKTWNDADAAFRARLEATRRR